jgi:PRTRC genetic system protein E
MPMLKHRTLLITVACLDEELKVNVIPAKLKEGEDQTLTTPLSFVGSAEELDSELGRHLASYVDSHLPLGSSLAEAKAEMDAAAKAARQKVETTQQTSKADPTVAKKDESPGPGQSVTTGFLQTLAKGLGASVGAEVLPEHVLARTPELLAWWSGAQLRLMFFGDGKDEDKKLNGKMFPHPALVFMIHGRELFVRALAEDCQPTADTRLRNAPYWNTPNKSQEFLKYARGTNEIAEQFVAWEFPGSVHEGEMIGGF